MIHEYLKGFFCRHEACYEMLCASLISGKIKESDDGNAKIDIFRFTLNFIVDEGFIK